MNIALATDERYLRLVHTALCSLFSTNKGPFHIHLLSNHISAEGMEGVKRLVEQAGHSFSVYPIEHLREWLGVEVPPTISVTSYARLFLPSILPAHLDKVLYVDCDILFVDDIRPFYETNLKNTLVGGVQDLLLSSIYRKEIGIASTEPYLNAGVLLIPLEKWRGENIQQRFVDYLLAHQGQVYHHDQGIINAVCAGRKTVCSPRYNVISNYFVYPYHRALRKSAALQYDEAQYLEARQHPAILHFTGIILGRPWEKNCTHPCATKFQEYQAQTLFKEWPQQQAQRSAIARLECRIFYLFPFWVYALFVRAVFQLSHWKHILIR